MPASARYIVGAVKRMVARNFWIDSSSVSGVNFSTSAVLAPKRSGKHSRPPRPKVKASGGEPMKMSSCDGLQAGAREAVAHRDHVAMEMHRALGLARRSRGEGDQRDVFGRSVYVFEFF